MKKYLLAIVLFTTGVAYAQNYTRDAGLRFGDYFSVTYRAFQEDNLALEGLLFFGRSSVTFTIMREHFEPAFGHISENLYFQYGYGMHVGMRYTDHYTVLGRRYVLDDHTYTPLLGLDGMIGLEYRFPEFPFLVSVDLKPYFEYSTIQIFSIYIQSVGFSIKYRF
jgi:hypothetical protein